MVGATCGSTFTPTAVHIRSAVRISSATAGTSRPFTARTLLDRHRLRLLARDPDRIRPPLVDQPHELSHDIDKNNLKTGLAEQLAGETPADIAGPKLHCLTQN